MLKEVTGSLGVSVGSQNKNSSEIIWDLWFFGTVRSEYLLPSDHTHMTWAMPGGNHPLESCQDTRLWVWGGAVSQLCPTLCDPIDHRPHRMTMGFPRQE